MPWVPATPPVSEWAAQQRVGRPFDERIFDPVLFDCFSAFVQSDTSEPAWTVVRDSETNWS